MGVMPDGMRLFDRLSGRELLRYVGLLRGMDPGEVDRRSRELLEALGLTGAAHIAASREQGVVARPLVGRSPMLTTYLLRLDGEPSETLARFIERVQAIDSPEAARPTPGDDPDPVEEPEL